MTEPQVILTNSDSMSPNIYLTIKCDCFCDALLCIHLSFFPVESAPSEFWGNYYGFLAEITTHP